MATEEAPKGERVGKEELFNWASDLTGERCTSGANFKNGWLFLFLMSKVFPDAVKLDECKCYSNPQTPEEEAQNFRCLEDHMAFLDLPLQALEGIREGKSKMCFPMLVMLFFLYRLPMAQSLTLLFDKVVQSYMKEFLESNQAFESLKKGNEAFRREHETQQLQDELALQQQQQQQQQQQLQMQQLQQQQQQQQAAPTVSPPTTGGGVPTPGMPPSGSPVAVEPQPLAVGGGGVPGGDPAGAAAAPAEVPDIGALVEVCGMAKLPALNGVQGRMLSADVDANRVLVEFPSPHGAMLVLPSCLRTVGPPIQPGSQVRAVNLPASLHALNGCIGAVLDLDPHSPDGVRAIVEFPPPQGKMAVRLSFLESVDLQVGSEVVVTGEPSLAGVVGRIEGEQPTAEGQCLVVSFPDGTPRLVPPTRVLLNQPALQAGARQEMGGQVQAAQQGVQQQPNGFGGMDANFASHPSQRELDKVKIHSLKAKQEAEMLQRENGQFASRVGYLEAVLQRNGVPYSATTDADTHSTALWRDPRMKVKGEELVTRLQFEVESLQRQLQLAREEKQCSSSNTEEAMLKMRLAFQTEREIMQKQQESNLNLVEVQYRNEVAQLQSYYASELKRITAQVKFEEDMMRQGAHGDTESLEEELLSLRQYKAQQEPLLQAMENSKKNLEDLVQKFKQRASEEEHRYQEAYEHCRALLQSLLTIGGDDPTTQLIDRNAPGWTPMLPLLAGQPLSQEADMALRDALRAHASGAHPQGLVSELLALALKVRQLSQEKAQLAKEKEAEVEGMKLRMSRTGQRDTNALQIEFQKGEEVERLRAQVERLKKALDFQREKEKRLPAEIQETGRDTLEERLCDGVVVPSHTVFPGHDYTDQSEAVCASLHEIIKARDWEQVERSFWVLVANNAALQHRVVSAGANIRAAVSRCNQIVREAAEERAVNERRLTDAQLTQKLAQEEGRATLAKEKGTLQVQVRIMEEQLQQAQSAALEQHDARLDNAALSLHADEVKFSNLHRRNKALQAAVGRLKMREGVLMQLVTKMREQLQVASSMMEARDEMQLAHLQRERQRIELDDSALVQQFQQLPTHDDVAAPPPDELDVMARSVVKGAEDQIDCLRRDMQILVANYENNASESRKNEVEAHSLRLQLEAGRDAAYRLKEECGRLLDDKARLQSEVAEWQHHRGQEAQAQHDRKTLLDTQRNELLKFEEIRQLLRVGGSSRRARSATPVSENANPQPALPAANVEASTTSPQQPLQPLPQHAQDERSRPFTLGLQSLVSQASPLASSPSAAAAASEGAKPFPSASVVQSFTPVDALRDPAAASGLHAKINEARRQIEEILASTKGVDPQASMRGQASPTIPPPSLQAQYQQHQQQQQQQQQQLAHQQGGVTRSILHDDAEFAKVQLALLDKYNVPGSRSGSESAKHPNGASPVGVTTPSAAGRVWTPSKPPVPTAWPDGQAITASHQ